MKEHNYTADVYVAETNQVASIHLYKFSHGMYIFKEEDGYGECVNVISEWEGAICCGYDDFKLHNLTISGVPREDERVSSLATSGHTVKFVC